MYTLELSIWERIQLDICLPRNAQLDKIEQLLRIMDAITLTADEKTSINFRIEKYETPQGPFDIRRWDDEELAAKEHDSIIKIETEDFIVLKKATATRPAWPTDLRTVTLREKIDSAQEDE